MEMKILAKLKEMTLNLDKTEGVSREQFTETSNLIKKHMGGDAAMVLSDSMEVGMAGEFYFPKEGEALRTWKRMKHAYKVEFGLDNENV